MDHTDFSGSMYSYSQKLTGGTGSQVGVAKSMKVYPGDKVKIEAYAKYYNPSGTTSNITNFALALTGAFGVTSVSTGEALKAYNALNNYGGIIASGGSGGSSDYPKLFVNILLFDRDFNFLDAGWEQIDGGEQVGVTPKVAHDYISKEITVKEAGYAYVFVSNENPMLVEFYVDDVKITHTPTNVIQYNEYYPFGLQTSNSWTRENNSNSYLYNAGSELNNTTQWYEMFFRGYDPAIGRMLQIDPYANSFASITPYNYALNSPAQINDPSGGYAYSPRGSGWGPRATIDFKLRAMRDFDMANIPYTWVSDLDNYSNFYGSYDGGGAGGHGGRGGTPTIYNRWCDCNMSAFEVLAYNGGGQNSAYRTEAQAAVDSYIDDEKFLKDFILKNFIDEIRSLNKLASEKDKRVTWFIDRKSKYTKIPLIGRVMDQKHANQVAIVLNWYVLAKNESSPHFLYLTIAHELVHVRDVLEGRIDFLNGFYGEDRGNSIAEYRAFERSGALERTLGVDYGHYDSFLSYRNQLPPDVIWDP